MSSPGPDSVSRTKQVLTGVLVVATVIASGFVLLSKSTPTAKAQDQETPRPKADRLAPTEIAISADQEKALEVKTVKAVLQRGDHPLTIGGKISLDLEKTARIRPLYNVTIYRVHKHAGEHVKKDDEILTVESTDLGTAKNNYLQAIANLEVAATTYRREALLRLHRATTDVDYENARSAFRQAAVALMGAREQCLLMGLRPFELEELRKELNGEVLSFARPRIEIPKGDAVKTDGPVADGSLIATTNKLEGSGSSPWEVDPNLIDLRAPEPDAAGIDTSTYMALRMPTEEERQHDALIALAEISKRFASPKFKSSEDGRRRARYTIRSPRDGVLISKDAAQGEFVDPSQVIATVADTSDVWINLDIYQQQIASVKLGAKVDVTTPAYPDMTFSGTITFLSRVVDDTTHTLRARVEVDNAQDLLVSGLVAKCVVHCIDKDAKVEVPKEAVLDDSGAHFVMVKLSPGRYERRSVQLGLKTDTVVHVEEGLKDGDEVVLEGNLYIHTTVPLGD